MTVSLVLFEVTGNFLSVEEPDTSLSTNVPAQEPITCLVTFYPRVPVGFVAYVANLDLTPIGGTSGNTAVAFPPIVARVLSGILSTIDVGDTVGISLLANSTAISSQLATIDANWLSLHNVPSGTLIYDVQFSDAVFGLGPQVISNFAFTASTDTSAISLTDPNLTRLPYGGP